MWTLKRKFLFVIWQIRLCTKLVVRITYGRNCWGRSGERANQDDLCTHKISDYRQPAWVVIRACFTDFLILNSHFKPVIMVFESCISQMWQCIFVSHMFWSSEVTRGKPLNLRFHKTHTLPLWFKITSACKECW